MQHLRLVGVHEDGTLLLLTDDDGHRYALALDEALRAAARRDRPRLGQLQIEVAGSLRPRDVQALIRAGMAAEEVAQRAGWTVEKVHRYEGPILAEREHVASLARQVRLRARGGSSSSAPTLDARVSDRLRSREIDLATVRWDSYRTQQGAWTALCRFTAGGRDREAAWQFDPQTRTVTALDDEARWLSEDEEQQTPGPIPAPHLAASTRPSRVYDVEAEGGVGSDRGRDRTPERQPAPRRDVDPNDVLGAGVSASARRREAETVDLMAAMRERSTHRGRRRRPPATDVPGLDEVPREAAPLEKLAADPREQLPPAAHTHPSEDDAVRRDHPSAPERTRSGSRERTQPVGQRGPAAVSEASDESLDEPTRRRPTDVAAPGGDDLTDDPVNDLADDDAVDASATPAAEVQQVPSASEPDDDVDELVQERATASDASPTPRRAGATRRSGRPSVPSWDDIMFGRRND